MAAVEGGVEGGDKDGSDSAGAGGALQGSFSDVAAIWEQCMVGDGDHVKSNRGIP